MVGTERRARTITAPAIAPVAAAGSFSHRSRFEEKPFWLSSPASHRSPGPAPRRLGLCILESPWQAIPFAPGLSLNGAGRNRNCAEPTCRSSATCAILLRLETQKRRKTLRIGRQLSAPSAEGQGANGASSSSKPRYDNCDRESEPFAAGSNTSWLLGRPGREIPSFC